MEEGNDEEEMEERGKKTGFMGGMTTFYTGG